MSGLRLYQIPEAYEHLEAVLLETGGELTDELQVLMRQLDLASTEKIENAWAVVKNFQALEEASKAEAERLTMRAKIAAAAASRLKAAILPAVLALGGKVKGSRWTVWTSTREGMSFELKPGFDVEDLPEEFIRRSEPELDKKALAAAAKEGKKLPEAIHAAPTSTTFVTAR